MKRLSNYYRIQQRADRLNRMLNNLFILAIGGTKNFDNSYVPMTVAKYFPSVPLYIAVTQ